MSKLLGRMHGELQPARKQRTMQAMQAPTDSRLTDTNRCESRRIVALLEHILMLCINQYNVTCSLFNPAHTDKGRVGAASHEDDNNTPRYLEQSAGGYSLPIRTSLLKQGDVWRGWPDDV